MLLLQAISIATVLSASYAVNSPSEDANQQRLKRAPFIGNGFANYGYNPWNSLVSAEPLNDYMKSWITSEHNRYRRMIPATNMRMMYWSEELAAKAQNYANQCNFRHSPGRRNIGENLWSAGYGNYAEALSIWFNEGNNPFCYTNSAFKAFCGHFFQMVWAETNLVGCGFARCTGRNVFVCQYSPRGNTISRPAYQWANRESERCTGCPTDAPSCHEGLCYLPLANERPTTTTMEPITTSTVNGSESNSTVAEEEAENAKISKTNLVP
jgi:hypothetical protein